MTKILAFDRSRRTTPNGGALRMRGGAAAQTAAVHMLDGSVRPAAIAVSVVVPTCGRPQLLNRCLASLALQHFDASRFEIIVVDDAPCDETRQVVTRWSAHTEASGPSVIYIPSMGPHGAAAARNHGWRAARGDIIAFTDDDTIASTDWLRNGMHAFDNDVDVVSGRVVMPSSAAPGDDGLDPRPPATADFATANCLCRRKVLEDLGGFDERFLFAWREDSDLYFRLLDYHAHIVREPRAVMMRPVRPAGWSMTLQQVKKVQSDALLYKKHPTLYRRRIHASPRWDLHLTVGTLLIALAALLAGKGLLAACAAVGWLYLTGRFCGRRLRHTAKTPTHVAKVVVTSALIPPLAVFWRTVGAIKFRVGFL